MTEPQNNDPPYKVRYEDVMSNIEEGPHKGQLFYDLPEGTRIYPNDYFWDTDDRHLIEVKEVLTKVRMDKRGGSRSSLGVYVVVEPDWTEPIPPHEPVPDNHGRYFYPVDRFEHYIEEGKFVPHRGNGLPQLP